MTTRSDMRIINRMVAIIKQTGGIHKWALKDEAGIDVNKYNQLQSYMKFITAGVVRFDKDLQSWFPIHVEPTETVKKTEKEPTLDGEH